MANRYQISVNHGTNGGSSTLHRDDREEAIACAQRVVDDGYRNETVATVVDLSADNEHEASVARFEDQHGKTVRVY